MDSIESAIEAVSVAPRVTMRDVENEILSEYYFTADDGRSGAIQAGDYCGRETPKPNDSDLAPLKLLTFCVGMTTSINWASALQNRMQNEHEPPRPLSMRRPQMPSHSARVSGE